jgi:hypothetical protein
MPGYLPAIIGILILIVCALMIWSQRARQWWSIVWCIVRPALLPIVTALLVTAVIAGVPAARELFYRVAAYPGQPRFAEWAPLWLYTTAAAAALWFAILYTTRTVIRVRYPRFEHTRARHAEWLSGEAQAAARLVEARYDLDDARKLDAAGRADAQDRAQREVDEATHALNEARTRRARADDRLTDLTARLANWLPTFVAAAPLIAITAVYAWEWWDADTLSTKLFENRPDHGVLGKRYEDRAAEQWVAFILFLTLTIVLLIGDLARGLLSGVLAMCKSELRVHGERDHRIGQLDEGTEFFLKWSVVLAALTLLLAFSSRLYISLWQALGTPAVFLGLVACSLVLLTFGVVHQIRKRWPLSPIVVLALLVLVSGYWTRQGSNDNHAIRQLGGTSLGERIGRLIGGEAWAEAPPEAEDGGTPLQQERKRIANRPTLRQWFDAWLRERSGGQGDDPVNLRDPARPYPLLVVAAPGGGLRAAMWATTALGEWQDRDPRFACHVFAIAGVSGGSLGAVVFDALLHEHRQPSDCRTGRATMLADTDRSTFRDEANRHLGSDFLAPLTAGMLLPDLVQRFLPTQPLGLTLPDRQAYLELAWEAAWADREPAPGRELADGFLELARPELATGQTVATHPALFLVASEVTEGRRWIASDVRVNPDIHVEAVDTLTRRGLRDAVQIAPDDPNLLPLRASSAAGASARFPWLSPPATLVDWQGSPRRLLDGGVTERSGALTAWEILHAIRGWCEPYDVPASRGTALECDGPSGEQVYVRPVALQLSNDAWGDAESEGRAAADDAENDGRAGPDWAVHLLPGAVDSLDPVGALMNSRTGRGREVYSRLRGAQSLRNHVAACSIDMALERHDGLRDDETVPLTWTLEQGAEEVLVEQACCAFERPDMQRWIEVAFGTAPQDLAEVNVKRKACGPSRARCTGDRAGAWLDTLSDDEKQERLLNEQRSAEGVCGGVLVGRGPDGERGPSTPESASAAQD